MQHISQRDGFKFNVMNFILKNKYFFTPVIMPNLLNVYKLVIFKEQKPLLTILLVKAEFNIP